MKAVEECLSSFYTKNIWAAWETTNLDNTRGAYDFNLLDSMRLKYRVCYENYRIILLAIGDHSGFTGMTRDSGLRTVSIASSVYCK